MDYEQLIFTHDGVLRDREYAHLRASRLDLEGFRLSFGKCYLNITQPDDSFGFSLYAGPCDVLIRRYRLRTAPGGRQNAIFFLLEEPDDYSTGQRRGGAMWGGIACYAYDIGPRRVGISLRLRERYERWIKKLMRLAWQDDLREEHRRLAWFLHTAVHNGLNRDFEGEEAAVTSLDEP